MLSLDTIDIFQTLIIAWKLLILRPGLFSASTPQSAISPEPASQPAFGGLCVNF